MIRITMIVFIEGVLLSLMLWQQREGSMSLLVSAFESSSFAGKQQQHRTTQTSTTSFRVVATPPVLSFRYKIKTSSRYLSNDTEESQQSEDSVSVEEDVVERSIPSVPQQQQQQPSRKKTLDPLFVALTKIDTQTAIQQQDMKSISLPIVGEVTLDRSLFLFVPLFLFAIGGFLLSFYILISSSDTFINAIVETSQQQSNTEFTYLPAAGGTTTTDDAATACRGLCSTQTQDIDGLRSFMNRIAGKN